MEKDNILDVRKAFEALARIMSSRGNTVIQVAEIRKKQDAERKAALQRSVCTYEKEENTNQNDR